MTTPRPLPTIHPMFKHVWRIALLFLVLGALAVWWLAQPTEAKHTTDQLSGVDPVIATPVTRLIPDVSIPTVVGWSGAQTPTPARGFTVQPFAAGLDHPRNLLVLPNGDVLVAESAAPPKPEGAGGIRDWIASRLMSKSTGGATSANRVTLLRDTDGDGRADRRTALIATGLNSPFGLAYRDGTLFVANTDSLLAYPFTPGATTVGAPRKLADLPANAPNYHWTKDVAVSDDGESVWVSVGSNSNIGEDGADNERNRAAILELQPKTGQTRIWASGLRNPTNLATDPRTGRLWAIVNERDELGGDLVPDYLALAQFGSDYGWPGFYWGGYDDYRVETRNLARKEYTRRPDFGLGAHVAPIGLDFATDGRFGPRFARGVFIGRHGSWNRSPPAGYDVVFVGFNAQGFPTGKPVPVLDGFLDGEGQARGRPAGVALDRSGGLLVADDAGNRVWRVTAAR